MTMSGINQGVKWKKDAYLFTFGALKAKKMYCLNMVANLLLSSQNVRLQVFFIPRALLVL